VRAIAGGVPGFNLLKQKKLMRNAKAPEFGAFVVLDGCFSSSVWVFFDPVVMPDCGSSCLLAVHANKKIAACGSSYMGSM
jgi:hypothetical protein